MTDTDEQAASPVDAAAFEKLTKELRGLRKDFALLHSHVQSLSSQTIRMDRDVRALALRKVVR